MFRGFLFVSTFLFLTCNCAPGDDAALTFEKDIRPIFRAHCFDCHGATEEMKGNLDLRLVRFLLQRHHCNLRPYNR